MRPVIHRSLSITASKEPKLYEHERLYEARRDAADDLYEALEDIDRRILCPVGPSPSLETIQQIASAALAKARAEQSL